MLVRLISHIIIAKHLAKVLGMRGIERYTFIFGSIEPDVAMFTYLRGLSKGRGVNGHRFDNVYQCIPKLFRLTEKSQRALSYAYRLGRLCHYVIDSFTFPHNTCFSGTLSEHMIYERKLHNYLVSNIDRILRAANGVFIFSPSRFTSFHDEYLTLEHDPESDAHFALIASLSAALSFRGEASLLHRVAN